jgi:hypothetical protein
VIARGEYCRIGAAEQRENGLKGEGLVLELQGQSGSEMRAMAQFAPMPKKPLFSGRMFNFSVTSGAGYDIAAN